MAVCSLALTAGVAFAGGSLPSAADDGLAIAAEAAGQTVPVVPETDSPDVDEPETEEAGTDDTHGALVSEAAQMETPEGFDNHGDFVSCVARSPHGEGDTALDLATVTKAACDDAKPGKARDAGEPESVGPTGNGASKSAAGKARGGH